MTDRVEIRGAARLRRTLAAAARDLDDLTDTHEEIGELVTRASQPPIRTGRLAASKTYTAKPATTILSATVRYASPVHWRFRPWLIIATNRLQPAIESQTLEGINDALSQVKGI